MVSISLLILTVLFFISAMASYHRLGLSMNETIVYTFLFVVLVVLISTWVLNLMSTHIKIAPPFIALYAKWMLFFIYYNLAMFIGFITFRKKHILQESFLNFNNEIVLCQAEGKTFKNILLLVPHCLQNAECKKRITVDIEECDECGKCDIAAIKRLAKHHKVTAVVATGGSLARKLVKDNMPDVIVAVACYRDLTDGVRDAYRVPVYGVLNRLPKGPCKETRVSINNIEFALKKFL